jgi:hypothetical protein
MFEQPAGKIEKDRSRSIMILSGVAVLAVIVLIVLVGSFARKPEPIEFSRPGTADYDSYAQNVKINNLEKFTGERLNVKYGRFQCSIENVGDKTIAGLQLRLAAMGFSNELFKEKIVTAIPGNRDSLKPGESMRVDASFEPIPDSGEIQDMTIEVYSLKLK